MSDASQYYTCTNNSECQPCSPDELQEAFCQTGGYKQPVTCKWNDGVAKAYQDAHPLPKYIACQGIDGRRAFFRNQFIFIALGLTAFVVYLWRRRKLVGS